MRLEDRWGDLQVRHALRVSERGQALLLVLLFLVPMVLAFGLVVRTNYAVVMKIRAQQAADAAALAAGSQICRVMNQVALHNMCIYKYHALMAATDAAIEAGQQTTLEVTIKLAEAAKALACWSKAVAH